MIKHDELKEAGISQYGTISTTEIVFEDELRKICEQNTCRRYGKTWACPPAIGSIKDCRERCLGFDNALVFNAIYTLEDSFDYEGMILAGKEFKTLCDKVNSLAKKEHIKYLIMANGGCDRCESCTYPEGECRMPDLLFPAIEGCAINVSTLAKSAGVKYINGENTVTYFGMLLY